MEKMKWIKKGISALLALNMVLSSVPLSVFAVTEDNLCEHHPVHTAECHYAEAVEGQPCTHVHSEACYAILTCAHEQEEHECTVESGCITMELDCHHTHGDCGYAEAVAPQDCTTCQSVLTHAENCGYVAPVAEVTCACVPGEDGTLVHTEGCGYVAPVEEVKCACEPTVTHGGEGCTYAEGKDGSPCTHVCEVKVDSAESCYKLLCSHKDGGHDDVCGYVAAVEAHECHYECAECAAAPASEEPSEESSEPATVCDCGTEDAAIHATTCAVYVAPENPVCYCTEKCTETNIWCDICGIDYTACTGTDTAAVYTEGTIDLSQFSDGDTINITDDSMIIGDGNEYNLSLNIAEDATVIFDVGAGGVKLGGQITVADGKTLTLLVAGDAEHTVNGGISLGNSSNVIIEGDLIKENNKLTVTGTNGNAGIGANNGVTAGDITIRNARVDATGSGSSDGSGAAIGTSDASMGNILIDSSIVIAAGGYYNSDDFMEISHAAAIGMGYYGGTIGNITLKNSEITASNNGDGLASVIGAGSQNKEGDNNAGTLGDIIITNTDLNLSMVIGNKNTYAAIIGPGMGYSYAWTNMGKIIFTDMTQEQLDAIIPTWLPSDFNQWGAYALGRGYDGSAYKKETFGGVWVSDGNGGTVQIGDESGYYIACKNGGFVHDFDEICGGTCSDCGVTYFVAHTLGTAATCTAKAVCSVCGESYGEQADHSTTAEGDKAATCTSKAYCSACKSEYGEVDADAHNYGAWTSNGDNTHTRTCANDNTHTENGDCSGGTATCTTQAVCETCGTSYGEVDLTNHDETVKYENGFCPYCDAYQPADLVGTYYQITNAGQLYWFAAQVNSGKTAINAELKADIKVNDNVLTANGTLNGDGSAFRVWTPIGTEDNAYTGDFCGLEYTVSGLYFKDTGAYYVGLFGYVGSGTVNHVGVIDSYFYGSRYVGGVVGYNNGTVECAYNTGTVSGTKYAGGVVGYNYYGTVQYVYNTGEVAGMYYVGGVTSENYGTVKYAYNTGTVSAADFYGGIVGDYNSLAPATNCYYLSDTETDKEDGTTAKTAEQFASGEVAWLLGSPFGQNIGTHVSPVVYLGYEVYQVHNCKNEVAYSNTNEDIGHIGGTATCTELAVCTVCGESYGEVSSHTPAENAAYIDNGDGTHSYTCTVCGTVTEDHTGGTATSCTTQANCEYCGASYGEVDTTNHDSTVAFDSKGFCPNGCYEPAVRNGDVYEISNAGQLYWFAQQVNNGETTISAILMNDIVINSQVLDADGNLISDTSGLRQWTPIGHYNSDTDNLGFAGTFDGNGKTISGLYHYGDTARYAGLFGYSAGTIRDLTIADTYIHTTHSDGRAGSVTGLNYGTVSNCSNYGFVGGVTQIGGICGNADGGAIQDCSNSGTISGNQYVGGIAGWNSSAIEKCSNHGTVSGTSRVGGIAGISDGIINNCVNIGSVEATGERVGGIAGAVQYTSTISNCFSCGTVKGSSRVGGVVGFVANDSTTNVKITNCYYDNLIYSGIAVGQNGGSNGSGTLTKVEGKTTEQFTSGELTWLLNGESAEGIWKQTIGTDTYPGFTGGTVYHSSCGSGVPYSNDAEETKEHNIGEDFRCVNTLLSGGICNAYESASQNAEGYYEIYNASQLYWFAEQVNGGAKSINAVLMNDIDLTNHTWITICSTGIYNTTTTYDDPGYQGIFNGNGHVIKNFTVQGISDTNCTVGLFGTLSGTVKNLGVDNMTFDLNGATDVRAAGIAGQMLDGSLIEDCYVVNSTLAPNGYIVGGIAACNYAGTIKDCFTKNVTIQANTRCGNLVSDTRGDINATDRPGTVTNCWTDADRVVGTQNVASYITDCHANAEEAIASGEIAYALGDGWGQTIGTDGYPVFGGATVYQVANNGCPAPGEYVYSNVNEAVVIPHEYTNGFCACGEYEPAKLVDDIYQIANAGNLFWLAQQRSSGSLGAFHAVLTADIVIPDDREWTPISADNTSTFDGGGHSITFNQSAGLFGNFNYSTVKNLILKGSINANTTDNLGAVAGSAFLSTIENVISYVDVTNAGTGNTGGLVGYFGGRPGSGISTCATIRNCAVYADISGQSDVGGIIGRSWGGTQYYRFYNCAYYGSLTGGTNTGALVGYNATGDGSSNPSSTMSNIRFENCYYCPQSDTIPMIGGSYTYEGNSVEYYATIEKCVYKSTEQFASGEVAWLLNGETDQGDLVWYQNIGMDAYPKFVGCVVNYNTESDTYHNGNTVSVSISWTEMSFTYTHGEWDPETHTYTGSWTADDGAARITVKNVGAANVPVRFTFAGTMGEVTGGFDVEKAALAPGRAVTTTLTVSGDPQKSGFVDEQIGTVTVSLGGSGWAAGDKVTFYAKDGNAYPSTVAEVTDSKLVLVSDNHKTKEINGRQCNDDVVLSLLTSVDARYPTSGEAAWGTYIQPWGRTLPGVYTDAYYWDHYYGTPCYGGDTLHIYFYDLYSTWEHAETGVRNFWYNQNTGSKASLTVYYRYVWDVEFAE